MNLDREGYRSIDLDREFFKGVGGGHAAMEYAESILHYKDLANQMRGE